MDTPITLNDVGDGADIIGLSNAQLIGRGSKRECYLHPGDAAYCIKVSRDRSASASLRRRLMKLRHTADAFNRRDWWAYCRYGAVLEGYVPRYQGFVRTSRGPGLALELVRDKDGRPSTPLREWMSRSSSSSSSSLLLRFHGLFDLLDREKIWPVDLNFRNFLVQDTGNGTARPWLIDLKRLDDVMDVFRPARWSDRQRRRQLVRRIDLFNVKFKSRVAQIQIWAIALLPGVLV